MQSATPRRGIQPRFDWCVELNEVNIMQTLTLKVSVRNHRIAEELPPEVPDGEAELEIRYEEKPAAGIQEARQRHLEALFARINQRSPNRSREDIDRQLAEERASWGD